MKRPISLCIVNYNGERYLDATLRAAFEQPIFEEIVVIDNESTDGGLQLVRERFPTTRVLEMGDNRGPGAARNAGFRAATHDLILFVDNDVRVAPDCAAFLVRALDEHSKAFVAAPRVLYADRPDVIQYEGANCHFLGQMALRNTDRPVADCATAVTKVNSVVTASFMVDRRRWQDGDLFDESFIFNYEDHDFGTRTRVLGHEILVVPQARVFHDEGTDGLSFRTGGQYSKRRVYCLIRNRWQIILKNYSARSLFAFAPCFGLYELFQFVGVLKKGWVVEWLRATVWMAFNCFEVLRKRGLTQSSRKTPDGEILEGGPLPFTSDLASSSLERIAQKYLNSAVKAYWWLAKRAFGA